MKQAATRRPERTDVPISRYRVQVLDRTIAVLQAVADSETDLAAADIARQLRLHKSTVHRLLVVLEQYRLIKKGPEGAYGLGTRLIELGECAIARLKLSEYAEPHLRKIAEETGEGAHVTILNGTELLSIAHVEGRWNLHSLTRTGQRTQIHCTAAGKAVLAFLSDDACDDLIARLPLKRNTRRTIVKPSAMKMELVRMRAQGYAVDDEEFEEGLRCVERAGVRSSRTRGRVAQHGGAGVPSAERARAAGGSPCRGRRAGPLGRPRAPQSKRPSASAAPRAASRREGPPFHIVIFAVPAVKP